MAYWDAVAQCETRQDWQNKGRFAGGLGIMNQGTRDGTWERWGGEQFAPSPDKATRVEQLVIANRVALFGWQTKDSYRTYADKLAKRPMFKHPVGYFGWGCIKHNVGNPCGKLKDGSRGSWRPPRHWAVVHCRK